MGAESALSGTCSACGRELVQVNYFDRHTWTYHPAVSYDAADGRCPALIPVRGTEDRDEPVYTLDARNDVFILDKDQKIE